jgi:hypothetical protein
MPRITGDENLSRDMKEADVVLEPGRAWRFVAGRDDHR